MLSAAAIMLLNTLEYRPDAERGVFLEPYSGIYWSDEMPNADQLMALEEHDRYQIFQLFEMRVRVWKNESLPVAGQGLWDTVQSMEPIHGNVVALRNAHQKLWDTVQLMAPRWAFFQRLRVSSDDLLAQDRVLIEEGEALDAMDVYSRMADGEIEEIAEDEASLTDVARQVLHDEIARRGLDHLLSDRDESQDEAANATEPEPMVTIRSFGDVMQAWLAKSNLESAAIECRLVDDNMVRLYWGIVNVLGGVNLQVKREDAKVALELLEQPLESTV